MSHMLEIKDGAATMAWTGETPWHHLGKKVPNDLTPAQMCEAAGVDWEVEKRQNSVTLNGKTVKTPSYSLIRKPNDKAIKEESILTFLPSGHTWHPHQNADAFAFFNEFVNQGDMDMETAGSIDEGRMVWALARVKESFYVVKKKDEVQSYLLFTNPHLFGRSIDVRFTPVRVVCNNTLTAALDSKSATRVASSHRRPFDADVVKEKLGLAHYKLNEYKERAQFLAQQRYTEETVLNYFKEVFPTNPSKVKEGSTRKAKETHKGADTAFKILDIQPGADIAPGTWWNAFNAATFYTNHLAGKTDDTRVKSLWYGDSMKMNQLALNKAVEYANAS